MPKHDTASYLAFGCACLLALVGCRIGGPIDEPDTVPEGGASATPEASTADGNAPSSQPPPSSHDASVPPSDASNDGHTNEASTTGDGGGGGDGACAPTGPVQVCDPVCNTGCSGLTRCDIADTPNTGACIGIWIDGEGTACSKTPSTDPCAVQLSCVDSVCRRLCWHDSDCTTAGAGCCKLPVNVNGAASGFHYCGACTP